MRINHRSKAGNVNFWIMCETVDCDFTMYKESKLNLLLKISFKNILCYIWSYSEKFYFVLYGIHFQKLEYIALRSCVPLSHACQVCLTDRG